MSQAPTHRVYTPYSFNQGEEEVTRHTEVGSAWLKPDTKAGSVMCISLRPGISVSGEIVLFEAKERQPEAA